jgi:hypothetical protein
MTQELCFLCNKYEVDGFKTGNWEYDLFCAICIEKQAKSEGMEREEISLLYKNRLSLQLVALGAIAKRLSNRKPKDVNP